MTGRRGRGRGGTKPLSDASASPPTSTRHSTRGNSKQPEQPDAAALMPPPPSTQISRMTRSQSRELEAEARIEPPRRGTRRNVREQSVQSIRSSTSRVTSVDFPVSQPQATLDPVVEELSSLPDVRDFLPSSARGSVELTPGRGRSQPKLNRNLLDALFRAADTLQNHLSTDDGDEETWKIVGQSHRAALDALRRPIHLYAEPEDRFVRPEDILEKVTGDDIDRPAAARAIAAANLASLLGDLFEDEIPTLVDRIDDVFPSAFLPTSVPDLGQWVGESFPELVRLALDIRTQRFIAYLGQLDSSDADPLTGLALIFCDDDAVREASDLESFNKLLDHGPYRNLDGVNIDINDIDELRDNYHTRISNIRSLLTGQGEAADLAKLEEHFPDDELIEALKVWASDRFDLIKDLGSSSLNDFVDAPASPQPQSEELGSQVESDGYSQAINRAPQSQAGSARVSASAIQGLMRMEKAASAVPSSFQPRASQTPDRASAASFSNEELIKKARILSSQNPPQSSANNGTLYAGSAAASANVKRQYESSPHEEDDEFERDDRVPDYHRRAQFKSEPAPKKVRIDEARRMPPPPRPDAYVSSSLPPSNPGAGVPSSSVLPPPPAFSQPDLAALSQMSRQVSLLHRKARVPQTRHRWTDHDVQLLIIATNTYKAKWSVIERACADGTLKFNQMRDQQALRDKARNIKVDFLKTDSVLPPAFDLVVLGRKERQAVIDVGRNPDRREMDLDVNGNPINTLYQQDVFA